MSQDSGCHARGCGVATSPDMFMCPEHWYLLPAEIRRQVVRWYRGGETGKAADQGWFEDAQKAVERKLFEKCLQAHGPSCACWKASPADAGRP